MRPVKIEVWLRLAHKPVVGLAPARELCLFRLRCRYLARAFAPAICGQVFTVTSNDCQHRGRRTCGKARHLSVISQTSALSCDSCEANCEASPANPHDCLTGGSSNLHRALCPIGTAGRMSTRRRRALCRVSTPKFKNGIVDDARSPRKRQKACHPVHKLCRCHYRRRSTAIGSKIPSRLFPTA